MIDTASLRILSRFCLLSFTEIVQLAPVKYNEKMMNSIWGLYNRNSPHNFKKNNAAGDGAEGQQQFVAAGGLTASTTIAAAAAATTINSTTNKNAALNFPKFSPSLFGSCHHDDDHNNFEHLHGLHHDHVGHLENYEIGPFAGHTHAHGHHGNYHRHHDHAHFEELWKFSVI